MNKTFKQLTLFMLSLTCVGMTACNGLSLPGSSQGEGQGEVLSTINAQVKIARSSDKILQSYLNSTSDEKEFEQRFMGGLTDDFSLTTYKNEYEAKQIIITPEKDVKDYTVEVSDFVNGDNKISKNLFECKRIRFDEHKSRAKSRRIRKFENSKGYSSRYVYGYG